MTAPTFLRRAAALLAASLVATTLLVSAGAGAAVAADVDGIAAAPADNGVVDQTRSRFSYQVEPGQTVTDEYLVQNSGTTAQSITVYSTDAFNSEDGSYALLEGDQEKTDVGTWVTFEGGADKVVIDLAPGESRSLLFTVTVPADASPGDHAGGIIASAITESGQIALDRRVAIRMYLRVKGELQPSLTVSSLKASYAGSLNPFAGEMTVEMTVTNAGNVALGAQTVTNVRGLLGIPLSGDVNVEIPEMLPGTTRIIPILVTGVGPWLLLTPHVSLTAITDPTALNPGPLPRAERETSLFAMPWAVLLLVVLVVAAVVFTRVRRRSNDRKAQEWMEYTEAEARRIARDEEERLALEAEKAAAEKPVSKKPAANKPVAKKTAPTKPTTSAASEE